MRKTENCLNEKRKIEEKYGCCYIHNDNVVRENYEQERENHFPNSFSFHRREG